MNESASSADYIQITADIVSAFVSNNAVRASELPSIIEAVHTSLLKASELKTEEPASENKVPAVPVKKSITDEYIICLEDGKKFKSLKRHLSTAYNMSPDEYRTKWGLSRDYPMVAPAYASARSSLARQMGLGRKRDEALEESVSEPTPADVEDISSMPEPIALDAPRKRGRPRSVKNAA
jgi:predicted transcriptional regulator